LYHKRALVSYREVGDRSGEATTLNNIGSVHNDWGQYDQALSYCEQALVIRREVGDRSGEGTTLNNIGSIYRKWGQYDQALSYYLQAKAIFGLLGMAEQEEAISEAMDALPD
jgi:tetratricopeptide (TPR) repeat protein